MSGFIRCFHLLICLQPLLDSGREKDGTNKCNIFQISILVHNVTWWLKAFQLATPIIGQIIKLLTRSLVPCLRFIQILCFIHRQLLIFLEPGSTLYYLSIMALTKVSSVSFSLDSIYIQWYWHYMGIWRKWWQSFLFRAKPSLLLSFRTTYLWFEFYLLIFLIFVCGEPYLSITLCINTALLRCSLKMEEKLLISLPSGTWNVFSSRLRRAFSLGLPIFLLKSAFPFP